MADEFALLRNAFGGTQPVPTGLSDRLKLVFIPYDELIHAFHSNKYGYIQLRINNPVLPEDAKVLAVQLEFNRRGFSCLVCSKEFDLVPCGEIPPMLDESSLEIRTLILQADGRYKLAE